MLSKGYKYFRWLSLDIVLGAILFLAFLERHYQLDFSLHIYFALSSAIWLIYTTDHLIDTVKPFKSERRSFHKQIYRELILLGSCVLVLALINIYFLPLEIIKNGSILAASCVGYLTLVYFFKELWIKEILVAVGYVAGILLAPFTFMTHLGMGDALYALHLFLIALINLLIFSIYDFEEDTNSGFYSFVSKLGKDRSLSFINILLGVSVALAFIELIVIEAGTPFSILFLVMTLLLSAIFWLPQYFGVNERFRVLGDAIFYLPIVLLW